MKTKTFSVRTFPGILSLLCLCVLCRDATANAIDRPNIVVILADDFGYGTDKRVDYTRELKPGPLELGFDYQFAVPQNHNDLTRVFVENHKVFGLRFAKAHGNGSREFRHDRLGRGIHVRISIARDS